MELEGSLQTGTTTTATRGAVTALSIGDGSICVDDREYQDVGCEDAQLLRWSVKDWWKTAWVRYRICRKIPVEQDLLRCALIAGDLQLALKALHPDVVREEGFRRKCSHLLARERMNAASLGYVYEDDFPKGCNDHQPMSSLEYLCQGSLLRKISAQHKRPRGGTKVPSKRQLSSDSCRAAVLRELFRRPEHVVAFAKQLLFSCQSSEVFPRAGSASGAGSSNFGSATRRLGTTPWHRCVHSNSVQVLGALMDVTAWHGWETIQGVDCHGDDSEYLAASDLRRCRKHCQEKGFQAFVVVGSYAYFRRGDTAAEAVQTIVPRADAELHIAPGPRSVSLESSTVLRMGQYTRDDFGDSPLDAALRRASRPMVRLIARLGGLECGALKAENAQMEILHRILYGGLPGWLARAMGTLPAGGVGAAADSTNAVLESATQIRDKVLRDRDVVMRGTGTSSAVAEALLRHHAHSPDAAIAAFRADPRAARSAARVPEASADAVTIGAAADSGICCGICFSDMSAATDECTAELRRLLPCGGQKHAFCDECLQHYVAGRLDDGDVRGLVCPDPGCRLPLAEEAVEGICGEDARATFVRLSASHAVDTASHITWCPRPGCDRAVAGSAGSTVQCSCGKRFCTSCFKEGGHEPATCAHWIDWEAEFPEQRRRQLALEETQAASWMQRHAKSCPGCRAVIQRSGGCNHMVCRCGRHFCYVCGRPWEEHLRQPGGLDHYACRLQPPPQTAQSAETTEEASVEMESEAMRRFQASTRSAERMRSWAAEAVELWVALHGSPMESEGREAARTARNDSSIGGSSSSACVPLDVREVLLDPPKDWQRLSSVLIAAVEAVLQARQTVCFSAVFMWATSKRGAQTGPLQMWLGELESVCGTLEAALGPEFMAVSRREDLTPPRARRRLCGLGEAPIVEADWPTLAHGADTYGDLRSLAARLLALEACLHDVERLSEACQRLSHRILLGARSGHCAGDLPGPLAKMQQKFLSWLGY